MCFKIYSGGNHVQWLLPKPPCSKNARSTCKEQLHQGFYLFVNFPKIFYNSYFRQSAMIGMETAVRNSEWNLGLFLCRLFSNFKFSGCFQIICFFSKMKAHLNSCKLIQPTLDSKSIVRYCCF